MNCFNLKKKKKSLKTQWQWSTDVPWAQSQVSADLKLCPLSSRTKFSLQWEGTEWREPNRCCPDHSVFPFMEIHSCFLTTFANCSLPSRSLYFHCRRAIFVLYALPQCMSSFPESAKKASQHLQGPQPQDDCSHLESRANGLLCFKDPAPPACPSQFANCS